MPFVRGERNHESLSVGKEETPAGEELVYTWYAGQPDPFTGIIVIKTDRFGQKWELKIHRDSVVTIRVAAGLLGVTAMTVTNWISAGVFPRAKRKNQVMVIPVREVERIARDRGLQLPFVE